MLDYKTVVDSQNESFALFDHVNIGIWIDDVTQARNRLDELAAENSADHIQKMLEQDPNQVLELWALGKPVWKNQRIVDMYGARDKQDLTERFVETMLPESYAAFVDYFIALLNREKHFACDNVFVRLNSQKFNVRVAVVFVEKGSNVYLVCSVTETTDLIEVKHQVSHLQSRYEIALRETQLGVWDWDLEKNVIEFDAEYNRILGYEPGELNRQAELIHAAVHPNDKQQSDEIAERVAVGDQDEYYNVHRLRRKDGNYIWARSHGRVCQRKPDGTPARAVGTMGDISSEVRNREFLKIERLIFQSSTAGIPIDAILATVANRIEEIYPDYRCAIHIFDSTGQFIERCVAPSMGEEYAQAVIGFDVKNTCSACQQAVEKRRIVVIPDFSADSAFDLVSQAFAAFDICGASSAPILSSTESALGTVCLYSRSQLNQSEIEMLGYERISRSLALIIEKEKQMLRQRTMQIQAQNRQKFESLGQLAGGIAHDFNNLLLSIICNAELIQMQSTSNDDSVGNAEEIIRASMVAANICKQMLAYAGKAETNRELIHVDVILAEISTLIRSATTQSIKMETESAEDLPPIMGDASALSQVFMNLLTNAVDAVNEDGLIQIKTGVMDLNQLELEELVLGNKIEPGRFVFVSVADNGSGFDSTVSEKVFDPFFTTKQTGRGLGLATVLGIVEQHGGAIEFESVPDEGTRFILYFPEEPEKSMSTDSDSEYESEFVGEGKKILVVDDHQFVRQSIRSNLEAEGCEVAVADCGSSAIEILQQQKFDYVLLDQIMPGLGGLETYYAIRDFDKDTVVCFMTGFAANTKIERVVNVDSATKLIRKPFQRRELLRLIMNGDSPG